MIRFTAIAAAACVVLSGAAPALARPWAPMGKTFAPDGAAGDNFGFAGAVSGDTMIVGAVGNDLDGRVDQGCAYIYRWSHPGWVHEATLVAPDGAASDSFGFPARIDGDTAVVGAFGNDGPGMADRGAAYVFIRTGTAWTMEAKLVASDGAANDRFGTGVTIEGDTIVVGAPYDDIGAAPDQGSAYVFVRSGGVWTQEAKLWASDGAAGDQFGRALSLSGGTLLAGADKDDSSRGAAYSFVRSGSVWTQEARIIAPDRWPSDQFGSSAVVLGDTALVAAVWDDSLSGSVYAFTRSGGAWSFQAKIRAPDAAVNERFGSALALLGERALIGSHWDDGAAYVFERVGSAWMFQAKLTAPDGAGGDGLGQCVGLTAELAVVGAHSDDVGANANQGSMSTFYIVSDPPTAAAGPDQSVFTNTVVYLDGSASWDDLTPPEGLTFEWSFIEVPPGSGAAFDDPGSPTPSFTPDLAGVYRAQLIVYDGAGQASAPDEVLITAMVDEPPTANAGPDQSIHAGDLVYLDGSGSFDDNTPPEALIFEWSFVQVPPGSLATFADPGAALTWFIADLPGTYTVQLVVWDSAGQPSAPDEKIISSLNLAPTADAGLDAISIIGVPVALSGAGSSDPEWDPLTYQWTLLEKPSGSVAELVSPTSMVCIFTPDVPGPYVVELVVSDPFGPSPPDTVIITGITGEEYVEIAAMEAIIAVEALPPEAVSEPGTQEAFVTFLTQVAQFVQGQNPEQAVHKLEMCIERTDGCVLRGEPDGNGPGRDWILDCEAQEELYWDLVAALNAITE